jgi:hypothetical protein
MCKKLAIISIDFIKNQSITASVLAKAQQSDDLLAPLRENIHTDAVRGRGYVIKNQILYKTYKLPFSDVYVQVCAMPSRYSATLGYSPSACNARPPSLLYHVKEF